MYDILDSHRAVQDARKAASITQRELADRMGTSQSAIAKLERGGTNPTVDTLARSAAAAGFALGIELLPLPRPDPVVVRYKQDVDRTLLRQNRRKTVDERLRTLSEWQEAGRELQRATRGARAARAPR